MTELKLFNSNTLIYSYNHSPPEELSIPKPTPVLNRLGLVSMSLLLYVPLSCPILSTTLNEKKVRSKLTKIDVER